jgi:hypothetical protein
LINRNKYFWNDLLHKQSAEVKRAKEFLKDTLNCEEDDDMRNISSFSAVAENSESADISEQ